MLDSWWLLILLPLAVLSGWLTSHYSHNFKTNSNTRQSSKNLPSAYFRGLNFLLNEQSENAIDAFQSAIGEQADNIEVQLALGNLYRRRGEIEKATQLHQNLITKTKSDPDLYALSLYELAQDYQKVGLFDRAETLFLELTGYEHQRSSACTHLLQIYEQEKDWKQAVSVIEQFISEPDPGILSQKAHYLCELAEISITEGRFNDAKNYLAQAMDCDSANVRVVIQSARIEAALGQHKKALKLWKQVIEDNALYLREVIEHIANAHRALNDEKGLNNYLSRMVSQHKSTQAMLLLTENVLKSSGAVKAEQKLAGWLRENPSITGLRRLLDLKMSSQALGDKEKRDYLLLSRLLDSVIDAQVAYQCRQCGFDCRHFYWQCPTCRSWDSIRPQRQVLNADIVDDVSA